MYYYTGIGSRKTPDIICQFMKQQACLLGSAGMILRSGGADGADSAFEYGAVNFKKEIYLPWSKFNNRIESFEYISLNKMDFQLRLQAQEIAASVHPAWNRLSDVAIKLHTRNVFQVLGRDLNAPSKIVICWTPNGEIVGGTATAIKIAMKHGIPVWNLGK